MAYLRVHAQYSYILQFLHSTTFIYWHACNNIIFLAQARPTMSCILLVYIPLDKMSKFNTSFWHLNSWETTVTMYVSISWKIHFTGWHCWWECSKLAKWDGRLSVNVV